MTIWIELHRIQNKEIKGDTEKCIQTHSLHTIKVINSPQADLQIQFNAGQNPSRPLKYNQTQFKLRRAENIHIIKTKTKTKLEVSIRQ